MSDVVFNRFLTELLKSSIDFVNDTFYVMLVTEDYTPDPVAHVFIDDITEEVVGTGYVAGGKELAGQLVSQDDIDNEGVFDGNNPIWTGASFVARGAIVYKNTGTPATSPVLFYKDFNTNRTPDNGDFTIQWGDEGIINVNQA